MCTQRKVVKTEFLTIRLTKQEKAMLMRMSARYGGSGMSKAVRRLVLQEAARLEMAQRGEGGGNG